MSGGDLSPPRQISGPLGLSSRVSVHSAAGLFHEGIFIAGQPVPAINRRLDIPPDIIPGGKKGHFLSFSHPFLSGMHHLSQGCFTRSQHYDLLANKLLRSAADVGAVGYRGEGSRCRTALRGVRPWRGRWGPWGSLLGGTLLRFGFRFF